MARYRQTQGYREIPGPQGDTGGLEGDTGRRSQKYTTEEGWITQSDWPGRVAHRVPVTVRNVLAPRAVVQHGPKTTVGPVVHEVARLLHHLLPQHHLLLNGAHRGAATRSFVLAVLVRVESKGGPDATHVAADHEAYSSKGHAYLRPRDRAGAASARAGKGGMANGTATCAHRIDFHTPRQAGRAGGRTLEHPFCRTRPARIDRTLSQTDRACLAP